eukprot:12920599-Prorocentrum_lima.AAC.1
MTELKEEDGKAFVTGICGDLEASSLFNYTVAMDGEKMVVRDEGESLSLEELLSSCEVVWLKCGQSSINGYKFKSPQQ